MLVQMSEEPGEAEETGWRARVVAVLYAAAGSVREKAAAARAGAGPWARGLPMRASLEARELLRELRRAPREEAAAFGRWMRAGRWQTPALVAAAYAIVAFWLTAPTWLQGGGEVLVGGGENPDWTGTAWAYWWTGFAALQGHNPFAGTWNFDPVGQRPVGQYNLLDAFMGAPFLWVFGPVLGYNLFAVVTLWSSGLASWVLARSAGAGRVAAGVAGLALMTSAFMLFELRDGRLTQTLMVFWLLGLAGLDRLARGLGTWRLAVGTGLMVAATHLVYWYNGMFLILCATPLWLSEWRQWDRARFTRLALAAGVTLLVCGPYVVSLARAFAVLPGVERELESWMDYGDFGRGEFGLNAAIRHSHWPLWPLLHPRMEPDDHRLSLGFLALALGGLLWRPAGRLRWLGAAAVGYVLTLGPWLKDGDGQPHAIPLPYLLLYDHVPFFNRLWWPGRMAIIAMVPLTVLAALHLERLASRASRWRSMALFLGMVAVLADMDWRNDFAPVVARSPQHYKAELYEKLDGALLTTPVLGKDPAGRHNLWFQVYHHLPIQYGLGAHIPSHRPLGYDDYVERNSLLLALAGVSRSSFDGGWVMPEDVEALYADGFRWAVVDPMAYSTEYASNFRQNFTKVFTTIWGQPDVEAGLAAAWRIEAIRQPVSLPAIRGAAPEDFGKPVEAERGEDD